MHFRVRVVVFCLLLLASQVGLAAQVKRKKAAQQAPPPPVEPAPEIPKPPPTPEELPAVPPHVSMQNGQLTISAENSTMGDVLNAVRQQTGATLDVPPQLSHERIAAKLGPGTPQTVVQQLFMGSKYDYIIIGSPQNPNALQRIVVTPRSGGGASAPAMAVNQPVNQPPQAVPDTAEAADETPEPEPEPMQTEPQPVVTPPTQAQPYSNQPKTPEQLLQELQQMQQQQGQPGRPPRTGGPGGQQPQPE